MSIITDNKEVQTAQQHYSEAVGRLNELEKEYRELSSKGNTINGRERIRIRELVDLLDIARDDEQESKQILESTINKIKNEILAPRLKKYHDNVQSLYIQLRKLVQVQERCASEWEAIQEDLGVPIDVAHFPKLVGMIQFWESQNPHLVSR